MYLVVLFDSLYFVGIVFASENTSLSSIGTLSSSEFAMLILSAFSNISFGSQKYMSRYCIFVRSSSFATLSKYGLVISWYVRLLLYLSDNILFASLLLNINAFPT